MRRVGLIVVDLVLIAAATLGALVLRDNFEISLPRLMHVAPYLLATLAAASVALPAFRIDRSVWRLTNMPDYLRLISVSIAIVVMAVVIVFIINRLDGIARSLPVLQGLLIIFLLTGARVAARLKHTARAKPAQFSNIESVETVLLVGLGRLAETYLRSVAEFKPTGLTIAGLLGHNDRQSGRFILNYKVLGQPEDVQKILTELEVRGVFVDRIVIAVAFERLSPTAQNELLSIKQATNIKVKLLAELMGLDVREIATTQSPDESASPSGDGVAFTFTPLQLDEMAHRPYWWIKRALDAVAALLLMLILAPIGMLIVVAIAVFDGFPLIFRQRRPGLNARPFWLFKFKTMRAVLNDKGERIADANRHTRLGQFLRGTRLDELPQLFNIVVGDMSFVGPRPLLPVDQSTAYAARLLVRPGLTGWAQVQGGLQINAAEKAILDVWYAKNASFALDVQIAMRTILMVIFGERITRASITDALRELHAAGICAARVDDIDHPAGLPVDAQQVGCR